MPPNDASAAQRVARLARFLAEHGLVRVCVAHGDEEIEVGRVAGESAFADAGPAAGAPGLRRVDTIKAELVGIFRLARPAPLEGEHLSQDRELAYVEALGIRNPVHSLGGGRIVSIATSDGAAVEYGQPLFLLDRG